MTNAWSDLVNTTLDLAAERDALADRLAGVPDVPASARCRAVRGGGCDGTSNGPTRKEAAMNEVPTYQPPEGVHGPTLGRDLPDGCERLMACYSPAMHLTWEPVDHDPGTGGFVYWWRFPPLQVGDRVQPTGTVGAVAPSGATANVKIDNGGDYGFPTAALTRVVTP